MINFLARNLKSCLIIMLCLGLFWGQASVAVAEVKPGDIIDKSNWEKVKGLVPDYIIDFLQTQGLSLKIRQDQDLGLDKLNPGFKKLTEMNTNVSIDKNGNLVNFHGGYPFPKLDMNDPQVGLKIAFNADWKAWADGEDLDALHVHYAKGGIDERCLAMYWTRAREFGRFMGGLPTRKPDLMYRECTILYGPEDVRGLGFVVWRYMDGTKSDDVFAYVPSMRRVRRCSGSQLTDPVFGGDSTMENYASFSGKVQEFDFKFIEKKRMLMGPDSEFSDHKTYKTPQQQWGGPNGWAPFNVVLSVRDPVFILEMFPKSKGHPDSKKVWWVDAQTFQACWLYNYDRKGEAQRTYIQTDKWWPEFGCFTPGISYPYDLQKEHGTAQPYTNVVKPNNDPNDVTPDLFKKFSH